MTNPLLSTSMEKLCCKPFLRWAGGKKWLIKDIDKFLPSENFNNYHELFLGGGALFFYLQPKETAYLNDFNSELIETYTLIQNDVESVITYLNSFKNTEDFYYRTRCQKFKIPAKRAARFIYLNQTSFNGIYRVNLNGEYNVPFGYRTKSFLDEDNLRSVSSSLKNVIFSSTDFAVCISNIRKGDLVFLDPPYTVAHNDNGFIKYNQKIFSLDDQYRLAKTIERIKEIGAYYILTNACHGTIKKIFDNGDRIVKMSRASLIGGKKAKRGKYAELVITNAHIK